LQGFQEERMQGGWHDLDLWRERQRDLLREAEARRISRTGRPDWIERLGGYRRVLSGFTGVIRGLGRRIASRRVFPPEEITPSRAESGLVEAIFEERACPVPSSSVIEFHREGEGYVIREVDLGTGDHILYLSTEEPEWAAWIWDQKTHG
jgi:hypothetical protein